MRESQIIICVGAGGVGKTTVASVLGLHHALLGQRTLVITVDPARRLLDALGIKEKASAPKQVDLHLLTTRKPALGGTLSAFMPDLKKEWMDFLIASINRADLRHEIAANHFYRYMADGLPGAFEIICSHVMFRLVDSGDYDTIILDTPPSSHSLNFFDVPNKMIQVLEQGVFRSLLQKRHSMLLKITKKLAFFSGGFLEYTLERIIGSHFLSELIDFALTIDGLYDPMLKRAKAMESLLKDKSTKYLLVLRPSTASVNDSLNLKNALLKRGVKIHGVVLNQTTMEVDQEIMKQEFISLKNTIANHDDIAKVEHLLSLYRDSIGLEKKLISRIHHNFASHHMHILYENNHQNRSQLLSNLLVDFERKAA